MKTAFEKTSSFKNGGGQLFHFLKNKTTHKGVNYRSKYVTQTQQQRPDLPNVGLTWHERKNKVH